MRYLSAASNRRNTGNNGLPVGSYRLSVSRQSTLIALRTDRLVKMLAQSVRSARIVRRA